MSALRPLTWEAGVEDGITPYTTVHGKKFIQLFQRIPFGENFYFDFEKNYDSDEWTKWTDTHWVIPIGCVAAYLLFIGFGTMYMKDKEPFDLRMPLAYWNLFLSIFSFIGAMRTVPDLLYRLGSQPFLDTICPPAASTWGAGGTGLWVMLFIYSKVPELIDTVFIVLRKKKLMFLHWYHHVTVLLYCWHSYANLAPQALYFVAMNYSVHAVMYGYYFLMAIGAKFGWLRPSAITIFQISQMVVGVYIQMTAMYRFYFAHETCPDLSPSNVFWGGLMYGSYFFLFTKFAVERYVLKKPSKKAPKTVEGAEATTAAAKKLN